MKNYWKRFVAWVTDLRDDPFVYARIKLTVEKLFITLVLFLVAGFVLNYIFDIQLRLHLTGQLIDKNAENQIIYHVGEELRKDAFILLIVLGSAVVVIGYFLAGETLVPIKKIVKTQKRFIAEASHELRTPLAIMKTEAEVLLMDEKKITISDSVTVLKSNIEEINRMSELIEDLLRLSYYDDKSHEMSFARLDFSEIARSMVDKTATLADKKSVKLFFNSAGPFEIMGNSVALGQLVINIVKNAILYTPEKGEVKVGINKNKAGNVIFSVKDNGVGINPKDISNIFKPFYKSESTKDMYSGGSGLGLTIVKKIVDRHQGAIRFESDIGKGTTVTVAFPDSDSIV